MTNLPCLYSTAIVRPLVLEESSEVVDIRSDDRGEDPRRPANGGQPAAGREVHRRDRYRPRSRLWGLRCAGSELRQVWEEFDGIQQDASGRITTSSARI